MEFCKVFLNFDSVDEILWNDHSNETSLPVISHGAIWLSKFYKMKFLVNFAFRHIWQWKGFIRIFYSEIKSYNHSRCLFHWLWVWNGQGLGQMSMNGVRLDPLCPKQNSVVIGANKGPYNTLLRLKVGNHDLAMKVYKKRPQFLRCSIKWCQCSSLWQSHVSSGYEVA